MFLQYSITRFGVHLDLRVLYCTIPLIVCYSEQKQMYLYVEHVYMYTDMLYSVWIRIDIVEYRSRVKCEPYSCN